MTTIETITNKQISELRAEAVAAGDKKMVKTCDRALGHRAWRVSMALMRASIEGCVAAIN